MNYGRNIRRAADIVWSYKFLMVLGFLAALGGSNTFNYNLDSGNGSGGGIDPGQIPGGREFFFDGPFSNAFQSEPRTSALALVVICLGIILALILFVVSNVARGGLIATVDTIEDGGDSTFAEAWRAGWERTGTLLGIGLIPAVPFLFFFLTGLLGFLGYAGVRSANGPAAPFGMPVAGLVGVLTCILLPISFVLSLLRSFANRAAMLEGLGAVNSYGRGLSVLLENIGEALLLFLLQIGISILLTIFFFIPGILAALCCILWPLLILFQGAVTAFFSALWTLAWREWTGGAKVVEKVKLAQ